MLAEIEGSARAVVVRYAYANGDPADAEVSVYSPAEAGRMYQTLRTDPNGRASFVPDSPGRWRVVADDGMGHRAEAHVAVDAGGAARSESGTSLSIRDLVLAALAVAAVAVWLLRKRSGSA